MSNSEIENRFTELVSLVRDHSGEHNMPITRQTLIENDLGVSGDDAYELILMISEKFQIDITGFNFRKYFNDEPMIFSPDREIQPFMVGHLEKAIIAGRLDEEVINN